MQQLLSGQPVKTAVSNAHSATQLLQEEKAAAADATARRELDAAAPLRERCKRPGDVTAAAVKRCREDCP